MKARRYCADECRYLDDMDLRRAQRAGAAFEWFSRWLVFVAAGWACELCGVDINPTFPIDHPQRATLDHVRPIGATPPGGHLLANVQAACFGCNQAKADQVVEVAA